MFGTTCTTARRRSFFATGSSSSRSLATKPSIHQLAMVSPGCCLAITHSTRFAPPSRSHGDMRSSMSARAASASALPAPANRGSGAKRLFAPSSPSPPNTKQSSGLPSFVAPSTTSFARCLDADASSSVSPPRVARATRSRCASFEYGGKYATWTQSPGTPPGSAPKSITSSPLTSSYDVERTLRQRFLSVDTHASYPRHPSG